VASLSSSRADLATTEFRLGTDPNTGLINHNGSFESTGASDYIKKAEGTWHHWAVVFDGWKERVYLDGELIKEKNNFIMIRPEGNITIGADANGTNNFMGYISKIRIIPMSLSSSRIKREYRHEAAANLPSLGDDDFEEIDPDSKFTLNPNFKQSYSSTEIMTLAANNGAFNEAPFENGGKLIQEVEGDFVIFATIDDMEGLKEHTIKGYNEGGLLIADNDTYYQFGAFPLYNCGNMFTILSKHGRPQFPNYKGYEFDKYIQLERKGELLYARSSNDGKTWTNSPGSPVKISSNTLKLGVYQTTYSDNNSWVKLKDVKIWK
jgi:hypothetical protein